MPRSDRRLAADFLDGDPLMMPAEVARLMRVHPKTVTHWVEADRLPDTPDGKPAVIRTVGGHIRIRESVVRGLLNGTLQRKEVGGHGRA
jgi:predicted site-specific integrase-resolvase